MAISKYIEPHIATSASGNLGDFLNADISSNSYREILYDHPVIEQLADISRLFIFGEPGFGKSRLLKELVLEYERNRHHCFFMDLKKAKQGIITYIQAHENTLNGVNTVLDPSIPYYSTPSFAFTNTPTTAIFLDALDEVHTNKIPLLLEEIKSIAQEYPDISIVVSCRTHHIQRYKSILKVIDFQYGIVTHLKIRQIALFLKYNCHVFKDTELKGIIETLEDTNLIKVSFFKWESTLSTPRYLEMFVSLIDEHGFEYVASRNRSELFDLFITNRLKLESKKAIDKGDGIDENRATYSRKIPHLKVCFERLALIMEIQRTNVIAKEDLARFDIDMNLGINQQMFLEVFYDGTLLKDNDEYLEFDNTEFQEYLAAKALLSLGRVKQIVFDIAVDTRLRNVYASWENVLGFLLEQEPSLLLPLIQLGAREHNPDIFLLIKYPKAEQIEIKTRDTIFTNIFEYYLQQKKWLLGWEHRSFAFYLSTYFNSKIHFTYFKSLISEEYDLGQYFARTHIVEILGAVFTQRREIAQAEKDYWKNIAFSFLKLPTTPGDVIHRSALQMLSVICTSDDYPAISQLPESFNTGLLRGAVINFYKKVDPNHPDAVKAFIDDIAASWDPAPFSSFNSITARNGFLLFFRSLVEMNYTKRGGILGNSKRSIFSDLFLENLLREMDTSLENCIYDYICTVGGYSYYKTNLSLASLLEVLKAWNSNMALSLAGNIAHKEIDDAKTSFFGTLLRRVVTDDTFNDVQQTLQINPQGEKIIFWLLRESDDSWVEEIFKKTFPVKFKLKVEEQKKWQELEQRNLRQEAMRDATDHSVLVDAINKNQLHAIHLYKHAREEVRRKLSSSQLHKLKKVAELLLQSYTPLDFSTNVKKTSHNTSSITQEWKCVYITDAVTVLNDLEIDPRPYQEQIMEALVYIWYDIEFEKVEKLIPVISEEQKSTFVRRYTKEREDDLHNESIARFIDMCKKLHLTEFSKPFLQEAVWNESINYYTRIQALKLLSKHIDDEAYFEELFNHYSSRENSQEHFSVAIELNKILLSTYANEDAFDWLVRQLFEKKYIIKKNNAKRVSVRTPGIYEGLGQGLKTISDAKFTDKMFQLLQDSFDVLQEESDYYQFASDEIWEPVMQFFIQQQHIKEVLKSHLEKLTQLTNRYRLTTVLWFRNRIERIRKEYMHALGESLSFGDAMKTYHTIRQKQYLDIAFSDDLFNLIQNVIETEFRNWVHQGFYKFIGQIYGVEGKNVARETLIQKHFVDKLENFLLKRGLRASDITHVFPQLYREIQTQSDKRVDLVITYGTVGPVMIEIKRADNSDLAVGNLVNYRENTFLPYMHQTNCEFGIFLLFLDRDTGNMKKKFPQVLENLKEVYKNHHNIVIMGVDCLK